MLSGGFVGGLEAIVTLAGADVGEYDAIFWGVFIYSLFGFVLGLPVGIILGACARYLRVKQPLLWSSCFVFMVFSIGVWVIRDFSFGFLCISMCLSLFGIWILNIFLRRTPLKVLPTPKGTFAMLLLTLIVSGVFSLTPGRAIGRNIENSSISDGQNVLLLVVDGLRMDRLGKGVTPSLDRFVSKAIFFNQAFTNSPVAVSAMKAIFSGEGANLLTDKLPENSKTLAETMSESGYRTAAFVNHISLGRYSNLHQGFENYRFLPPMSPLPLTEAARRMRLIRGLLEQWGNAEADPNRRYRKAEEVMVHLRHFINEHKNENWFAVAHIRETAAPYFANDGYAGKLKPVWPNMAPPREVSLAYAEELHRVDTAIGQFLGWMDKSHLLHNTMIVFISTHGADFDRHENGPSPYQHQLHVPIAIQFPNVEPAIIQGAVQLTDLPMTIATHLGLPLQEDWGGEDMLSHHHTGKQLPARPVYTEFSDEHEMWDVVRLEDWKFVRRNRSPLQREELYNLRSDPTEQVNLIDQNEQQRQRMIELLHHRKQR